MENTESRAMPEKYLTNSFADEPIEIFQSTYQNEQYNDNNTYQIPEHDISEQISMLPKKLLPLKQK